MSGWKRRVSYSSYKGYALKMAILAAIATALLGLIILRAVELGNRVEDARERYNPAEIDY